MERGVTDDGRAFEAGTLGEILLKEKRPRVVQKGRIVKLRAETPGEAADLAQALADMEVWEVVRTVGSIKGLSGAQKELALTLLDQ